MILKDGFKQSFTGYEVIEKTVSPGGHSGRVFVPKKWLGKSVKIILMEPADE
ncbi:MAG: DUF2080 family transposase-associated protein [Methanocalculus sp. MSAO_Arc1]|nr:MAG: DUF2080 family transposase-associated protein [Methanocalculus sp. MSAO_Arc1]